MGIAMRAQGGRRKAMWAHRRRRATQRSPARPMRPSCRRRIILVFTLILPGGLAGCARELHSGSQSGRGITVEQVRKLRAQAAARKRPLVVHGDGRPMDPKHDELEKNEVALIFPQLPGTRTSALTYSLMHQFNV